MRLAGKKTTDLFSANPLFTVKAGKLADGGDHPLTRTADCPDRLDQKPAIVVRAALLLGCATHIHGAHYLRMHTPGQGGGLHDTPCPENGP